MEETAREVACSKSCSRASSRLTEYLMKAFLDECTPGYYNNEGGEVRCSHLVEIYAPGVGALMKVLQAWRDAGDLKGMVLGD